MEAINVSDAKGHFSEYISRAAAGERFVIQRRERPLAVLISVTELDRLDKAAQAAQQLAYTLGQQAALLEKIEAGQVHPAMAAFGLWEEEADLAALAVEIAENRQTQPERPVVDA